MPLDSAWDLSRALTERCCLWPALPCRALLCSLLWASVGCRQEQHVFSCTGTHTTLNPGKDGPQGVLLSLRPRREGGQSYSALSSHTHLGG